MTEVKIGNKVFQVSEDEANQVKIRCQYKTKELKELAGLVPILITIGGLALGYVASDIANDIASELE